MTKEHSILDHYIHTSRITFKEDYNFNRNSTITRAIIRLPNGETLVAQEETSDMSTQQSKAEISYIKDYIKLTLVDSLKKFAFNQIRKPINAKAHSTKVF